MHRLVVFFQATLYRVSFSTYITHVFIYVEMYVFMMFCEQIQLQESRSTFLADVILILSMLRSNMRLHMMQSGRFIRTKFATYVLFPVDTCYMGLEIFIVKETRPAFIASFILFHQMHSAPVVP